VRIAAAERLRIAAPDFNSAHPDTAATVPRDVVCTSQQSASRKRTRHTSTHPDHRISYGRPSIQHQIHRESSIQRPSRLPRIRPLPHLSPTRCASFRHLATPAPSTTRRQHSVPCPAWTAASRPAAHILMMALRKTFQIRCSSHSRATISQTPTAKKLAACIPPWAHHTPQTRTSRHSSIQ
jgi:hypothetical protein